VGFISKWYLVLGAIRAGWYLVALLILFSSLLAVIYIWRIVEVAYFRESSLETQLSEAPVSRLVPTWVLIGATLFFGLHTDLTVGIAREAAIFLFGGAVP
jgi:multicomponent Na+:H+ antiporter subunit D